jgi:hypothetical protein
MVKGQLHEQHLGVSEEEATRIAYFLDSQNAPEHSLFFESTVHNWNPATEELAIMVTYTSEVVARDSLEAIIQTARAIHGVHTPLAQC